MLSTDPYRLVPLNVQLTPTAGIEQFAAKFVPLRLPVHVCSVGLLVDT